MKKIILSCAFFFSISMVHATTTNGFNTNVYGFIKTSSIYSTSALGSFNNINLSAPTHAVPQTRTEDKRSRLSFQVQQSRFGAFLTRDSNLSGHFEFDFTDFNKSSPTTQMNPRVRILSITFQNGDNTFILGQDWDLFSPVTSYTFDIVGLNFLGGNTGFMRQQFQFLHTKNDWEFGSAVGMAGNNPGTSDSDLETSKTPSYSARISRKLEKGRMGLSGIYAKLSYHSLGARSHETYGLNSFYEQVLGIFSLKSELYYSQNLANIGSLSIGKGTSTADVKEYGGNLTMQIALNDTDSIITGAGFARVNNKSQLAPFALSNTNAISSPGIRENVVSRIGWEKKLAKDFSWVTELSRYQTVSKVSGNNYEHNIVHSLESGFLLRF